MLPRRCLADGLQQGLPSCEAGPCHHSPFTQSPDPRSLSGVEGFLFIVLGSRHLFMRCVRQGEHGVGEPFSERVVVAELFEELRVVTQKRGHHANERFVVFDAGVLPVGVLDRIAVSGVSGDSRRYLLRDQFSYPVFVLPVDVSELIVEHPEDVAEVVQFWFRPPARLARRYRADGAVFVRTYNFLASILPYTNAQWEKLSIFLSFLVPKLPAPIEEDLSRGILEAIDMDSYRVEKQTAMKLYVRTKAFAFPLNATC